MGCIATMLVASCTPFPFVAMCDDVLTMLVCATRWLSMHLYMLAYTSMHESCLLWKFDPNLHLSLVDTTFRLLSYLFAFLLVCSLCCFFACHAYDAYPLYAFSYALCIFSFHCLSASFFCLCLCMHTHGARTLGARAQSLRRKQKGRGCKHADISQAALFSRFWSLAFPFLFCTLLNPLPSPLLF